MKAEKGEFAYVRYVQFSTYVTEKGSKLQEMYHRDSGDTSCITCPSTLCVVGNKHQFREALCGNIKTTAAISGKTDCGSYLCLSQGRS